MPSSHKDRRNYRMICFWVSEKRQYTLRGNEFVLTCTIDSSLRKSLFFCNPMLLTFRSQHFRTLMMLVILTARSRWKFIIANIANLYHKLHSTWIGILAWPRNISSWRTPSLISMGSACWEKQGSYQQSLRHINQFFGKFSLLNLCSPWNRLVSAYWFKFWWFWLFQGAIYTKSSHYLWIWLGLARVRQGRQARPTSNYVTKYTPLWWGKTSDWYRCLEHTYYLKHQNKRQNI